MSLGSQVNVAQEFSASPGAPGPITEPAAPTPATTSQLPQNGLPPVAPTVAPLQRTVSAPAVGVATDPGPSPVPPHTQAMPHQVANTVPASTAALMGPPPPQPQHITVERGCQKKTRLVWTQELHMRFLFAVEKIGLRTAVPRTILQVMQVDGLTRENIASHLQKYRRLLEKKAGISGPVGTKDWPKLETAQTHHLAQLRKQMDSATAAADAATTAAAAAAAAAAPSMPTGAGSNGAASDPGAARPVVQPQHSTATAPAAAVALTAAPSSAPQTVTSPVLGPAPQPPQQLAAAPVSAPQPAQPVSATPQSAAPMWQAKPQQQQQRQQQQPPPSCMPPPTTPNQLPPPGICPVTPQEPAQVPVPTSDAEGNTLGVPMPQPIMPPLMCVLPQSDGSPALLPMLPAMYMASYGRNTADFLGTIPLSRQQVPGMPAPPTPAHHPHPYPHAHAHAHAPHHMGPAPMSMYPASYSYPAAPAPSYQAMPLAQPAGIGSPMFPPSYGAPMPVAPMVSPMPHDPNMHVHHATEMPGMHGGYAWQRPGGWQRPPTNKAGGPPSRSTLPPLVADRQLSHHAPPSSAPQSHGAPHMQTRAASGARNGTNGASCSRGGMDHDAAEHDVHGMAGHGTARRQPRGGNRAAALQRRSHSNGGGMHVDTVDGAACAGGTAADVDWTEDAIANIKLDPLALTSSTLRIANIKLDPGVGNDGTLHAEDIVAALGEIPDGDVEDVAAMDLDELGWPAWPEANSSGNGDVDLEQGDEGGTEDPDDPVANAIADIFEGELSPQQQKRKTRNSMSANFM